jgi:hypothetical protein
MDPPPRIGWKPSPFPIEAELSVAGKKIQSEVCASPYNLKRIIRKKKKKKM